VRCGGRLQIVISFLALPVISMKIINDHCNRLLAADKAKVVPTDEE
jgi:hypothetical protein